MTRSIDLGREVLVPIRSLAEWILTNAPRMDAARSAYTAQHSTEEGVRELG
ncbi:MAG TPA: hypothetical protein VI653_11295 [Steroidobacteraceae bacterium]